MLHIVEAHKLDCILFFKDTYLYDACNLFSVDILCGKWKIQAAIKYL